MDLGLSGKTFVVTAASGGLGRGTADALVADGARVVLVARGEARLKDAVATYGEAGAYLAADLADPGTAAAAARLATERFGRLDGALVSVGGPPKGGVLDNTDAEWTTAFDSVFLAALRVTRAVLDVLDSHGYDRVQPPTIEFEKSMASRMACSWNSGTP